MANDRVLHIICPPQRRVPPVILLSLVSVILVIAINKNIRPILAGEMYSLVLVSLVIFAIAAGIIYRNLFFRDQACFLGAGAPAPDSMLSISASDIIAVRRRPAPEAFTVEGKMQWLGLGQGPIVIETSDHDFCFGVGLGEFAVDETIRKIVDFCSAQRDMDASNKPTA